MPIAKTIGCGVTACPAVRTPHGHMPESERTWRPTNRLAISDEARVIAGVILASYDGLTEMQRQEYAAMHTDQSFLSELVDVELVTQD